MKLVKNVLKPWLPFAVAATLIIGLGYTLAQQVLRMSANDPQIQMAEDAATALAAGQSVESIVPSTKVDIASSLAPYLVVFDESGKPIASSGWLHNQMPTLPPGVGVFDYVRAAPRGENRITWQPERGVRSAIVVVRISGARQGFVMAGRSLREVEVREDNALQMSVLGGIATLGALLVVIALLEFILPERAPK